MSTSPSTIAVTIDPAAAPGTHLDDLVRELAEVCEVTVQRPVASVSLVGTAVRQTFDRVGGALQRLHGLEVEMVAQGAADHHLTFVVQEQVADALVRDFHQALFEGAQQQLTWAQIGGTDGLERAMEALS